MQEQKRFKGYVIQSFEKPKSEGKWNTELSLADNINWDRINMNIFFCTKDTRLVWFQYRILHRILATNKFLFMIRIADNPNCSFCKTEVESLKHLFYDCTKVREIWNNLHIWLTIHATSDFTFDLVAEDILLGKVGKKFNLLNLIITIVKYYIYSQKRCGKYLCIEDAKYKIAQYFDVEKNMYKMKKPGMPFSVLLLVWKIIELSPLNCYL